MALLNVPLLALPLVHHGLAITFVVTSLLAAGTNLAAGALALGQGERAHAEQQARAVRRLGLGNALLLNTAGALVVGVGGAFMMALAPRAASPSWWAALGVVMFGVTGLVHFSAALVRLHRLGRRLGG